MKKSIITATVSALAGATIALTANGVVTASAPAPAPAVSAPAPSSAPASPTAVTMAAYDAALRALQADLGMTEDEEVVAPLCELEESNACLWLASEQGNGKGDSFYADANGTTYVLTDEDAQRLAWG